MNYRQLSLQRYVLEEVKEGRTPSVSNDEKVDLDYIVNNYDNIIRDIEKEMKKNEKLRNVVYRLVVNIKE